LVPESARWLALHGRVEAQKAWKRILPYKQSDLLNDTDSAKKITYVLKHSGCDSSTFSQSKKANKQEVVNNGKQIKINSNPVDSVDFGYAETGIQLLIGHGEDCKGIRKQDMEGKLKVRSCNDSSVGIEHRRIMPEHIKNVENISSISLCKPDGCDSDRSQNSHYSKSSDISITEVNHLLSCEIMNNCRIKINETDRLNNRKNIMLVEDDEMANVTLLCTNGESSNMMKSDCDEELKIEKSVEGSKTLKACSLDIINSDYDVTMDTVSSPCHSVIVNEMNGIQKSNGLNAVEICRSSSKSDGLNFVWTETAQLLEDNEENSICLQSMSGRVDKTRIDYEGHEGEYTGKIFSVDDNKVNANPKRRTHTNIIVSGEEDSTSGTDVGFGNGMSCGNMVNKICKFAENKTVPYAPKKKETPTRCTGFFELFRNDVLRKYNVIMVFSWYVGTS
jgi:cellobiose-specific phosphotransferase system component IIB